MTFKKGDIPNPNGRPKGAGNKITQEARALFLQTIENQMPNLEQAFEFVRQENPAEYLKIVEKYAQYFIAKKVDITSKDNQLNASLTQITDEQLAQSIERLEKGTGFGDSETGTNEA